MICGSDFRAAEMRLASILPRGLAAGCFIALLVAVPRLFSVVAIGHFFHAGAPPGEGGRGRSPGGAKNPKRRRQRHAVKSAAMPRSSGGAGGTRASRAAAQRRAAARRARRGGPAAPGRRFEAAGGEPGGPQGQAQARPQTAAGGAHKAENKLPRNCAATARAAGGTEPPPRRSAGAQRGGGGRTSPRVTGAGRPRQGGAQAAARSAGAAQQAQPRGSRPGRAAMRRGCWRRPRGGRITGAHRLCPGCNPGQPRRRVGGACRASPHGGAGRCSAGVTERTVRRRRAAPGRGTGRTRAQAEPGPLLAAGGEGAPGRL